MSTGDPLDNCGVAYGWTYTGTTSSATSDYWITYEYPTVSIPPGGLPAPLFDTDKKKLMDWYERHVEKNKPLPRGVEMATLYKVTLCYAEDRKAPIVQEFPPVIATSPDDARLKSGVYSFVLTTWDEDYLTILTSVIGDVKVKSRPSEVKQV